jgi:pimeloyl-ACP methyl ester carboxylesterase
MQDPRFSTGVLQRGRLRLADTFKCGGSRNAISCSRGAASRPSILSIARHGATKRPGASLAGGEAFAIDWALVQPVIAEKTRVCAYDRAGLGWSDAGRADETVEQTIEDLHALLRAASEKGPFVLVGASIGGIFIRAYQRAFPEEVAALVFSNSSNRVAIPAPGGRGGLLWDLTEEVVRSAFPPPASSKGRAPTAA